MGSKGRFTAILECLEPTCNDKIANWKQVLHKLYTNEFLLKHKLDKEPLLQQQKQSKYLWYMYGNCWSQ
jgi:hypothetical protein